MTRDDDEGIVAQALRDRAEREKGYRERALKLFPHVCARCGREHSGKNLRQLTVHHKDHDHDNNPPDGSNWELLCVYCHDNEHQRDLDHEQGSAAGAERDDAPRSTFKAFEGLGKLFEDGE